MEVNTNPKSITWFISQVTLLLKRRVFEINGAVSIMYEKKNKS